MAKLHVWYPSLKVPSMSKANDGSHPIYKVVENVGHAAMTIEWGSPQDYVSWWPDESHTSFATPSHLQDIEWEGGPPTVTVPLKGLNELSMSNWWNRVKQDGRGYPYRLEYLPKDDKWTLDRNNCSHIVALAMKIGGAEKYASLRDLGTGMVTPIQLHVWAKTIQLAQYNSRAKL